MTHQTDNGHPPTSSPRAWAGLAALALPTLVIGLDLTVLHLAVPAINTDLRPGPTTGLWIIDAYGFAVAGLLLTMGTVGDRIGRRRLLLIGAAGFAAASAVAALSSTPAMLVAARAALGIAGATLMPSTLSLIRDLFPDDRKRTLAISIWMASLLTGSAIGPVVGGALLELFWWGSVFLIAIPVMAGLLIAGPRLLPPGRGSGAGRIDPLSVVTSLVAVLAVVYAVKDAAAHGFGALTPVLVVLGVLSGVAFVRRQQRLDQPLLDIALFRDRIFSTTVAAHLGTLLAFAGIQYLIALYLQIVVGLTPLTAGLWTLIPAALGLVGALSAPRIVRHLTPRTVIATGLAVGAAAMVLLVRTPPAGDLPVVLIGFGVASFASSLITSVTTDRIIAAAPENRAGMASGISETAAELGIALGMAFLGSIATAVQSDRTDAPLVPGADGPVRDAFTTGLQVSAAAAGLVLGALAVLVAVSRSRDGRRVRAA